MKKLLSLVTAVMFVMTAMAQYKTINYQGVLTKADGTPVSNTEVWLNFELGTEQSPYMAQEKAQVYTNEDGFFSHEIGSASGIDFSTFNWAQTDVQIRVTAYNFGETVTIVTPVSAVPAAMYAVKSGDTEELRQDVESTNGRIIGLDGALADYRDGLLRTMDEVSQLYDELYNTNADIESLKTWLDMHGESLEENVREMVEKLVDEGVDTTPMIEQLRADMEAMQNQLTEEMKSADQSLFYEMETREEDLKNYTNDRIDELWKGIDDLTKHFDEQDTQLAARIDIIVNTVDILQSWLDANAGNIEQTVKEMVEKIIADGLDTAPIMEQLRAEMNSITMQIMTEMSACIETLRSEMAERDNAIITEMDIRHKQLFSEMVDRDAVIESDLRGLQQDLSAAIENLKAYIDNVNVEVVTNRGMILDIITKLEDYKNYVDVRIKELESNLDIDSIKALLDSGYKFAQDALAKAEELAAQLEDLPQALQALQNKINNLEPSVEKNTYYLNQLEYEVAAIDSKIDDNSVQIENIRAMIDDNRQNILQLLSDRNTLEAENNALKNAIELQQAEISDLTNRYEDQQTMIEMLMQEIAQLKADKQ